MLFCFDSDCIAAVTRQASHRRTLICWIMMITEWKECQVAKKYLADTDTKLLAMLTRQRSKALPLNSTITFRSFVRWFVSQESTNINVFVSLGDFVGLKNMEALRTCHSQNLLIYFYTMVCTSAITKNYQKEMKIW